ncbi:hypothetical protein JW921_01575 [Candidatus Fermentibacterales bacterium]|nr:hypothetical protein [Candidatus Fermentibacterales bacterium]
MKGYEEGFRLEDGVLHVRLSGEYPMERLRGEQNVFQPVIDSCSSNDCRKVLVDARNLETDFDTMELFRAGADVASLARNGIRVALLAREEMLDPFFEDVAVNRGGNVAIFTDDAEALAWLRGPQKD